MLSMLYFGTVLVMTLLSLLLSGAIQSSACSWRTFFPRLLAALGVNGAVFVLAHGLWTGAWMPARISLEALSYQQLFDIALVLLTMYVGAVLTGRILRHCCAGSGNGRKIPDFLGLGLSGSMLLAVSVLLFAGIRADSRILISEFYLPDKETTLHHLEAYIELVNDGSLAYETKGLYLSDDANNPYKFPVEEKLLPAGETLLIPVDDTVFSFGRKGGYHLYLSDRNGAVLDEVLIGDTRENKAYARCYSDRTWKYTDPTPGTYNLEKPTFSAEPGFYDEAFYLELKAQPGTEIYFTADGSVPTTQSEKYAEKILIYDRSPEGNTYRSIKNVTKDWQEREIDPTPVPKARVIRAIAVNEAGVCSEIATATYFVNLGDLETEYTVSLVADPEALFGPQGIYSTGEAYDNWYLNGKVGEEPKTNFETRGLECAGNFELFREDNQAWLNQPVGIRIQGGSHRTGSLKRMSVFAREKYSGSEYFDRKIFGDRDTHSVALRAGFENAFTMELVPDRNLATQSSIPVTVFLNGEYWYKTYLQEKYNDEHFEEVYGLEDVEFQKAGVTEELRTFVAENDMQTQESYRKLEQLADLQSYIDFLCANIYLGNTDYAESLNGGNAAIWRSRKVEDDGYGDGRWRWALYDMDLITEYCRWELGLSDITDAQLNTFTTVRSWAKPLDNRPFFAALKTNPEFRKDFVLTFMDMANTCFAPEQVEPVLRRWGSDLSYHDGFFLERNRYITQYLGEFFSLTGTQEPLTISISDPAAGRVQVNTCYPDLSGGSWSGNYYTDYPVTVTAQARDGYTFLRWEGDVCSDLPTVSVNLTKGGMHLYAVFKPQQG